ncbi:hypothetical protein [Pararhodonellum marinum]|uniref:hypothetical protein n=1 Tax=Pararhodonellum marinum TaxID=2755358 RepID=UPI00188FE6C5|nr:hypothetical protein [Pararhodonellum marinum]
MKVKNLEKTVETTLEKLEKLKIESSLAAELAWCFRSYEYDGNPVGLIEKSQKALEVLKEAREKNSKAVSKKLIEDLEKVALN